MFCGFLPSFEDACAFVGKLHIEQNMTFYDMERKFRKVGISIYLFGEEPQKSKFTKGLNFGDNVYALMISVKRCRDFALKDAESGCHDVHINLTRLKNTKMTLVDNMESKIEIENFVASQVDLWCSTSKMEAHYVPHIYAAFETYLRANPSKQQILNEKHFVLREMNPEQFAFEKPVDLLTKSVSL